MDTKGVWEPDPDTDFRDFAGRRPPKKLMFTLTGKCNLRCQHCFRGIASVAASQTPLPLVDYVLDQIVPHVRSIRLGGTDLGEQLTSRHALYFLERIRQQPGKHLEIISNLTVMDERIAGLLAETCDELRFSLEGVGPAFERVRGFSWDTIEHNLEMLVAARRRNDRSRLQIIALVTCFHDNLHELVPILDLVDRGVDRIEYRLFIPNAPVQESQSLDYHRAEANEVFRRLRAETDRRGIQARVPADLEVVPLAATVRQPARELTLTTDGSPEASGVARGASKWVCPFPFETVSMLSDGQVGTCCKDIRFGTLDPNRPRLDAAWRSRPWQALRRSVAARRWEGHCRTCDYRLERDPCGQSVGTAFGSSTVGPATASGLSRVKRLMRRVARRTGIALRVIALLILASSSLAADLPPDAERGQVLELEFGE